MKTVYVKLIGSKINGASYEYFAKEDVSLGYFNEWSNKLNTIPCNDVIYWAIDLHLGLNPNFPKSKTPFFDQDEINEACKNISIIEFEKIFIKEVNERPDNAIKLNSCLLIEDIERGYFIKPI
jgi:hypothetical protein